MSSPPPSPPPPDAGPAGDAVAPDGRALAGPWRRVAARVLDTLAVNLVIGSIIDAIIVGEVDLTGASEDLPYARLFLAAVVMVGVWFVWDAVLTATRGGSPMKLALGLRVVRADTAGPIGWGAAVMRWGVLAIWWLVPILSLIAPLVIVIVSLVFLFTRPLRQTVWDRVARTLVVSTR